MSQITPTDEQAIVVSAVAQAPESLMVTAYAGCAKSTTLQLAAPGVRQPALALAFNKRIATDLAPRLPGNFSVKTLNGLGHGAWVRALPVGVSVKLDDKKLGKLVSQVATDRRLKLSSDQWDFLRRLVTEAMLAGITPRNVGEPLTPDEPESWEALAEKLWMPEQEFAFLHNMAHEVLERNNALARQGVISFDDQIYASVCLGGQFPRYPVVFVDETQDLSPLQHAMLRKVLREDGRLVAVGDPKQAIYGFRNADSYSMTTMRKLRSKWLDLPLATTFRCPKVIVARQQEHAPGFRAWQTNRDGRFARLPVAVLSREELEEGWHWGDVTAWLGNDCKTLAVLCRNNAPLLGLAFKLLRQGIGVVMLGRDIGKGLQSLAKKLAPDDNTPADIVKGLVLDWKESESGKALANQQEERVAGIEDRAECLLAVLSSAECRNAGELRDMLGKLFARDSGLVTLSSIHRAKGAEWDLVLHLDPWRIPSKQAKRAALRGDRRALEQELNLRYVCETRTRHTLLQADLGSFQP